MDQKKNQTLKFIPLIFSFVSLLFLLGTVITYKIKYIPEGKTEAIKEEFGIHLWDMFNSQICPTWAAWIIVILILLGGILPLLNLFVKEKYQEGISITSTFISLIALMLIAAYKEIFAYFASSKIANYYSSDISWASALAMFTLAASAFTSLSTSPKRYGDSVQGICEDGLLIAMAFVMNFVKIPAATGAGSINFQMLPLFIIALRRGPLHGFICGGIVYGLLTCLTDGYGLQTYPFDYLLGFGSVAIVGLFRKLILKGDDQYTISGELYLFLACGLATLIRFIGSSVSSMVFYGLDFAASMSYNSVYIPVSGAIAAAMVMLLLGPIKVINKRYPVTKQ